MLVMQQELIAPEQIDVMEFTVYGHAMPGGSKKAFKHPHMDRIVVVEDSKNKPWKSAVAKAGLAAVAGRSLPVFEDAPLGVEFTFYRARPQSHLRTNGQARDGASAMPTTRPDVLKLARAVEDALTEVLWRDDSLIVDETLRKRWGDPERVEIRVWRLG